MTRRSRHAAEPATAREVVVVAAVLVAGSEKAAAHRLGLSHSTVKHHLANSVQGRSDNDGAARVDPGAAVAGAGGRGPSGRVAVCSTRPWGYWSRAEALVAAEG